MDPRHSQAHSNRINLNTRRSTKGFNEPNARRIIERQFFFRAIISAAPKPRVTIVQVSPRGDDRRDFTFAPRPPRYDLGSVSPSPRRSLSLAETTRRGKSHVTRERRAACRLCFLPTASGSSTYLAESSLRTRRRRAATSNPLPLRHSDSLYRRKGGRAGAKGEGLVERIIHWMDAATESPNKGDRGTRMTVVGGTIPHDLVDHASSGSEDADRSQNSYRYRSV